jgi:hypothetical protein
MVRLLRSSLANARTTCADLVSKLIASTRANSMNDAADSGDDVIKAALPKTCRSSSAVMARYRRKASRLRSSGSSEVSRGAHLGHFLAHS